MKHFSKPFITVIAVLFFINVTSAALITFDDLVSGTTAYSYDGDADGIADVLFSTTDPSGFNTVGPGSAMTYINEPGIEGSTLINAPGDLRVDFFNGAINELSFGFALFCYSEPSDSWASFMVYDKSEALVASATELGLYSSVGGGSSSFPEDELSVAFSGIASYAIFDFDNRGSGGHRYIIDNFKGTYGSTEHIPESVPEPGLMTLLGISFICSINLFMRKKIG